MAEGAANGTVVGLTASSTDPNGPAVTYSLTDDAGGRFTINSSTTVGGTSTANFTIAVTNVDPVIDSFTNSSSATCSATLQGQAVSVSAAFHDLRVFDTHTATIVRGDGMTSAGVVTESNGSGSAASHTYLHGGFYTITVTMLDDDGGSHSMTTQTVVAGVGLQNGTLIVIGTNGRDMLIGGDGADRIIGDADDDILIAGTSSYDNLDAALLAIMQEWTSGNSYAVRTANIFAGTGVTGGNRLVGDDGATQTVFNADTRTGSQGIDWLFPNRVADNGGVLDTVTDRAANELWSDTDF